MLARRPPPADGLVLMPMRMGRSEEYAGLAALEAREVAFAYLGYLRRDHDLAVRLIGIAFKVILMVALGRVEPVQRLELGAVNGFETPEQPPPSVAVSNLLSSWVAIQFVCSMAEAEPGGDGGE